MTDLPTADSVTPLPDVTHDSAIAHVTGSAIYTDDIPEPAGCLHMALGLAPFAHGRITALDLSAVRAAPGVVDVLTAADVPGTNDISPTHRHDEPILAEDRILFHGQPIFAVVAQSREAARLAARLAKVSYVVEPAILDVDAARAAGGRLVTEPLTLTRGDTAGALAAAPRQLTASLRMGGQDHFYLEGHIALAIPGEGKGMHVFSSTQHPSEVQHMVAGALGVASHDVVVECRRMGGGFGGKETQSNQFAALAAIAARRTGRAVKLRPDRDEDMIITGKRHDFRVDYTIGYDDDGMIHAADFIFAARCGFSADLSGPVTDRALFHCDNAYFYPAVRARSEPLFTNTVSNTAFRGFGGPQGVLAAERVIEEIAFATGLDPYEVRLRNLYAEGRDLTPYHQRVTDNILPRLMGELAETSDYRARRAAIRAGNTGRYWRGIALTPVKFGISFTATWYNQAGALVHIYTDGSILVNHGGTEMGQGLFTKVASVVASALGQPMSNIRVSATRTDKIANTSATAASSGADLNGMAAQNACDTLLDRLRAFARERFGSEGLRIADGRVYLSGGDGRAPQSLSWAEFIKAAYMARVQLWASGFYKTPEIHWDRASGRGQPFYYYAYGAACAEVEVDSHTGENRVLRVDILHDVGNSLNPALDLGQVEGGFVQGMGWLTTEELWWDAQGRLRTHAPSTYKIPLAGDIPPVFNVRLAEWSVNPKRSIRRSKAVGEPPFMLGTAVFMALSDAVATAGRWRQCPRLDAPATPERLLTTIQRLRS